jgi:ssDNA-binding Zn-finger/Zn-ribbon topoisomerase 1
MSILEKFVTCEGCNTKYTINFKKGQVTKSTKCDKCGKHNIHFLNNAKNDTPKQNVRKVRQPWK